MPRASLALALGKVDASFDVAQAEAHGRYNGRRSARAFSAGTFWTFGRAPAHKLFDSCSRATPRSSPLIRPPQPRQ